MDEMTVAIIQARMGSTRLPEKVMMNIGNKPMLAHVFERASHAALVDEVVIATSTDPGDDAIKSYCVDNDIPCYRGSEQDVLSRYYQVAHEVSADVVVRITADCPLLSPPAVDQAVGRYQDSDAAYVTNSIEYTYPDGLDVEVFSFDALETAHETATEPDEREHVTVYIKNSNDIDTENVNNPIDITQYSVVDEGTIPRWTVDYPEDMKFVRQVYERLTHRGHWVFDQQSVFELLEREPNLAEINEDR